MSAAKCFQVAAELVRPLTRLDGMRDLGETLRRSGVVSRVLGGGERACQPAAGVVTVPVRVRLVEQPPRFAALDLARDAPLVFEVASGLFEMLQDAHADRDHMDRHLAPSSSSSLVSFR